MGNNFEYKRSIVKQLFAFRLISIFLVFLILFLFWAELYDYGLFVSILLIPLAFIVFTKVIITEGIVNIRNYSFFGLVKKTFELTPKNILSMTLNEDILEMDNSLIYEGNDSSSFIDLLLPTRNLVVMATEFKYLEGKDEIRTINIKLKNKEYKLAWEALNRKQ